MSDTKKMVDSFGRTQEENKTATRSWRRPTRRLARTGTTPSGVADFAADLTESILLGFDYRRWSTSGSTRSAPTSTVGLHP
jgi:hypothetical protein